MTKRPTGIATTRTEDYLSELGVALGEPHTSPFDPGYDLYTLLGHLEQSSHLMSVLKISMACWLLGREQVVRNKVKAARLFGVPVTTGGGPFEVAVAKHRLPAYLDLCADVGYTRIECGQGFTTIDLEPAAMVRMAAERDLEVQYEVGGKHDGPFTTDNLPNLLDIGHRWLDAGAVCLVVEARESAQDVGLFDDAGRVNWALADRLASEFGLAVTTFEAPTKASQFLFLGHFGRDVHLSNVRLEELLRVEIYRHGLHSDAFADPGLRPTAPVVPSQAVPV